MKFIKPLLLLMSCQILIGQVAQDLTPFSLESEINLERTTIVLPSVEVNELFSLLNFNSSPVREHVFVIT